MKSRAILVFSIVSAILCSLCIGMNVTAENEKATLTVECKQHDLPLEGMAWDLYYIADIEDDGSYKLAGDFANYPVNVSSLSTSGTMVLAETLESFVETDNLMPASSGIVREDGLVKFSNLSYGLYLISGIPTEIDGKEYIPTPSIIAIDRSVGDDFTFNYNVVSKPKIKVLDDTDSVYKFNATVKLFWEKDDPETRPGSVKVTLTRDGVAYKTATLSDANNWTTTWKNLSSKYKWNVVEDVVPEGYTVTYVQNEININPDDLNEHDLEFIITNTGSYVPPETTAATKPEQKPLPYTGQLWWPVPILSAVGMAVFAIGWLMNIRKRKRYEK